MSFPLIYGLTIRQPAAETEASYDRAVSRRVSGVPGGRTIRRSWGAELLYTPTDPGQDDLSVGTLEPLWNLFDLTREGRPSDWEEQLSYSP